jgi:alkanesulfonate monooxygenase SsuD/methylene tetrahydromethanopterin reductase-like flavin-dependent oxidoreductase (luciferase family)
LIRKIDSEVLLSYQRCAVKKEEGIMDIGKLGAFCFLDAMPAAESAAFCRRVERMGYKVLWAPEAWGRDPFAQGGYLLAKTDQLIYATGIANIWARDPATMAASAKTLAEVAEGRFILGIGVSHRSLVEDLRGHTYTKPYSYPNPRIRRPKPRFRSITTGLRRRDLITSRFGVGEIGETHWRW